MTAHRLAANLEWLFTEAGEHTGDRVRAAAAHGFDAVEIWGWRSKDLDEFAAALDATGVELISLVVDGAGDLTDPGQHDTYLRMVEESLDIAIRLGSPNLVTVAGIERPAVERAAQHAASVSALERAVSIVDGSGVTLLLEPLNNQVDHLGTYLTSTREGLEIVREVGSPTLRLLFDVYHALMMEEDIETELSGSMDLVGHVQIADLPGRNEPGCGTIDWGVQLATLDRLGYRGLIGLEYKPTGNTLVSLAAIEKIAGG